MNKNFKSIFGGVLVAVVSMILFAFLNIPQPDYRAVGIIIGLTILISRLVEETKKEKIS